MGDYAVLVPTTSAIAALPANPDQKVGKSTPARNEHPRDPETSGEHYREERTQLTTPKYSP
jgi:hypothetical protein